MVEIFFFLYSGELKMHSEISIGHNTLEAYALPDSMHYLMHPTMQLMCLLKIFLSKFTQNASSLKHQN